MAPFDVRRINWYRARMTWCVRGFALVLAIIGFFWIAKRTFFALVNNWSMVLQSWNDDLGDSNKMYAGLALIAVASTLLPLSSVIARLIVVVPPEGCPRCRQTFPPTETPTRCAECGLQLGDSTGS